MEPNAGMRDLSQNEYGNRNPHPLLTFLYDIRIIRQAHIVWKRDYDGGRLDAYSRPMSNDDETSGFGEAPAPLFRPAVSPRQTESFGQRIKRHRIIQGWNQAKLADLIHATQPSVSRYERDIESPSDRATIRLAELFEVTPGYLRYGVEAVRGPQILGVLMREARVRPGAPPDLDAIGRRLAQVLFPFSTGGLYVQDDSNLPEFERGQIIVYKRMKVLEPDKVLNRRCVIQLNDGSHLVRRLKRGYASGRFNLSASNAPEMENAEIRHADPVIAVLSDDPPDTASDEPHR